MARQLNLTPSHGRALNGLSGAKLLLREGVDGAWLVRKTAKDPAGSARLQRQALKQRKLAEALAGVARLPAVHADGEEDGCYFFEMEFVNGVDGPTFLGRASLTEVEEFAAKLCRYFRLASAREAVLPAQGGSLFETSFVKLRDIVTTTDGLDGDIVSRLFMGLEAFRTHSPSGPSLCHGDFTLENMLIDGRGELWLIDALDVPVETFWQDVAKVHQDLEGGWYLRAHPPISSAVLGHVSARINAVVDELSPEYRHCHYLLLTLAFLRILPYVCSPADKERVLGRVRHFVSHLP